MAKDVIAAHGLRSNSAHSYVRRKVSKENILKRTLGVSKQAGIIYLNLAGVKEFCAKTMEEHKTCSLSEILN